jgi:hypothetical protein
MRRRDLLGTVAVAGAASTAGCGLAPGDTAITDPELTEEGPGRAHLSFVDDGTEVGTFGVDVRANGGVYDVSTEHVHADGTKTTSLELAVGVRGPDGPLDGDVAVVAPLSGDQGEPPDVSLTIDRRRQAAVVAVENLGDLRDETISTLDLLVDVPEAATALTFEVAIDLAGSGVLDDDYTLKGAFGVSLSDLGGD